MSLTKWHHVAANMVHNLLIWFYPEHKNYLCTLLSNPIHLDLAYNMSSESILIYENELYNLEQLFFFIG